MASGAAKRYAQAVFGLAKESGSFEAWEADLARLSALLSDERAAGFLESPRVPEADKLKLLDATLASGRQESRNLARLLLQRDRLGIVPEMADLVQALILNDRGIAVAEVTTAEPLDAQGQEIVKARLKQMIGKDIELRMKTDPAIIGGIVARIGDQLIDGSVINQLRRLRTRLATAG